MLKWRQSTLNFDCKLTQDSEGEEHSYNLYDQPLLSLLTLLMRMYIHLFTPYHHQKMDRHGGGCNNSFFVGGAMVKKCTCIDAIPRSSFSNW